MAKATTVDGTQFAKLVGCTPRNVRRLTAEGILTKARGEDGEELRNRYELAVCILAYCNYLRSQAKIGDQSETRWIELRSEKMANENKIVQMKVQQMEGKLYIASDVMFNWTNMLTHIKSRILAIPSRVARQLIGKKTFRAVYDVLMAEIHLCLQELSDFDPHVLDKKSDVFLATEGADTEVGGSNGQEDETEAD